MRRYNIDLLFFSVLLIFAIALFPGCSSSSAVISNPPASTQSAPAPVVTSPPVKPPSSPDTEQPSQITTPSLKTEVIYTHMTQRCVTCLCFESRIKWVVDKYYKEELGSGKLTFLIINAQDTKNADLVKKLGVVGSQLFVNTIVDGKDHIKDISEIWNWNCNDDPPGFCEKVLNVIDRSLEGKY
ncbi:MAG: nitrophenyl compound nitroreductase subunit ArsF family protein [Chloroflexi bacterium]|nr:nitrophenyl compound nitroreductase subunit ArsF family protein [Chloroflexota bacterium]